MKVCKRLQIDYAEAVVDFEFGHRMAVPVISGVVIAEEYHDQVMEELEKDEAERARKEDEKRRKAALGKWRKFLMGMRIIERIRQEYGEIDDSVSVFGHGSTKGLGAGRASPKPADEDMAGGFLPEGYEEEEGEQDEAPSHHAAGFFPTAADEDKDEGDDTLVMEGHEQAKSRVPDAESRPQKNASATRGNRGSTKRKAATRATRPSTRKRRKVVEEDEEEVEDESAEDSGGQDDPDGQASAYQDSDDE
jgi:xeroderma pigmentosum group C-complementing protein